MGKVTDGLVIAGASFAKATGMARIHDFMIANRAELLRRVCASAASLPGVDLGADQHRALEEHFELVVQAVRSGDTDATALPGNSEAAASTGIRQFESGLRARDIPLIFGALSVALGELANEQGVSFPAIDYGIFDGSTDAAIAKAIESYTEHADSAQDEREAALLGSLAHELRNDLWSARVAYDQILRGSVKPQGRTAQLLGRSLSRMDDLVSQALARAQLESGQTLHLQPLSVAALLSELKSAALGGRGGTLHVEVDGPLEVRADERLLGSALRNLIHNALKFSRERGAVTVRARREADELVVEVEDACGGLPAGATGALFRPFSQHAHDRSGLGLGLSITRAAVAAHGGQLHVHDRPGQGCTFVLRQPIDPPTA